MKFLAEINIMPHKELLDPQGKAVLNGIQKMNMTTIENVRIGKKIDLTLEANSQEEAKSIVTEACEKLLVNKIMEQYQFSLTQSNG